MKTLFCSALILCCFLLKAQSPYYERLTVDNELPENRVQSALQDSLGYVWLGTQNGLVRYDGYKAKIYSLPDEKGQPINYCSIRYLAIDSAALWVYVSYYGLYYYDRRLDAFKHIGDSSTFKTVIPQKYFQDERPAINWFMVLDPQTRVFHIQEYNKETGNTNDFNVQGKGKYHLPAANTVSIARDVRNSIWVTADSALYLYNQANDTFTPNFVLPANWLFNDVYTDANDRNTLWMTTAKVVNNAAVYGPVVRFNTQTKGYVTYSHLDSDSTSLPTEGCEYIYTAQGGRLWFIGPNQQFSVFNYKAGNFGNYHLPVSNGTQISAWGINANGDITYGITNTSAIFSYNPFKQWNTWRYAQGDKPGDFPDAWPISIFFDKSGILWFSGAFGGEYYVNPQKTFFNIVTNTRTPIRDLKETNTEDGIFLGVYDDTTLYVKNNYRLFKWNVTHDVYDEINLRGKVDIADVYFAQHMKGMLFIATYKSGLFTIKDATGEIKQYKNNPNDSTTISFDWTFKLAEGRGDTVWVGTWGGGLCMFNTVTGKFKRYPYAVNHSVGSALSPDTLDGAQVITLLPDNKGGVWIGTNSTGGLSRLDINTGRFTTIHDRSNGFETITSLCFAANGNIWAGTYLSGLFLVNPSTGAYKRYTQKDGLIYDGINQMAIDVKGNLWLTTNRGMSMFDVKKQAFKNFTTVNGLPENNTRYLYQQTGPYKNIIVFTPHKFFGFDPGKFSADEMPPGVVLESVSYHAPANDKNTTVFTPGLKTIHLSYNENDITLQFTALHFLNTQLNTYKYKLSGYDKDWVDAGSRRFATYTKLPPGTYTFTVTAANADGVWNSTGASLEIVVSPPWWKTWWAYTMYTILFIAAIAWVIRYRARKLVKENTRLEQKVALRTEELNTSLAELKATQNQLVQAEKMASLGELTAGIAHEIQNPLNFVNNFSELSTELMEEMNTELDKGDAEEAKAIAADIKQNLQKINHHGKRADAIVKGMLQHSRKGTGAKELTNITALADEYLRLSYHGLRAKDKAFNAALHTSFDENIGSLNMVAQDIGRVLLNMYNNAFYAVSNRKGDGYQPSVWLYIKKAGGKVIISIRDNGTGMPEKIKEKIFQPFFTTKPTGEGVGLGLSLSYDIIKAHEGEIQVETAEGQGTTFIILLPATK